MQNLLAIDRGLRQRALDRCVRRSDRIPIPHALPSAQEADRQLRSAGATAIGGVVLHYVTVGPHRVCRHYEPAHRAGGQPNGRVRIVSQIFDVFGTAIVAGRPPPPTIAATARQS